MAENETLKGVIVGIGLVLAIALLIWAFQRAMEKEPSGSSEPRLTQHQVIRDEHGRIQSVETFRGMGTVQRDHPDEDEVAVYA